ncbi:hypothetical protein MXD61_14785 [Frankia sp. AgPm24]|uniref:hypothetical protein n=1 Tax=Frankia sp. AgPm24 TaxID=631128 RepID=UPI00200D4D0D|nr:hypothetical protein [Frankia sp. AgPm24]MCK9923121.1 hypothetical protein [Frankia sp. AgPm24]
MTQPAAQSGEWSVQDDPLEPAEILDSDELGSTEAGRDPLDDTWDAPDRPSDNLRFPATPREERRGASLDRLLSAEVPDPDPYLEAERRDAGREDVGDGEENGYSGDRDGRVRRTGTAEERALHLE